MLALLMVSLLPAASPVSQARPVPSLLRGYSAPVKMTVEGQTDEDLVFLLAHDTGALF